MDIECSMKTFIKSRIHLMRAVFHQQQTWDAYEILLGRLARHDHHKHYPVQSEYVARTVSSKKRIRPLSVYDRGFSCALEDALTFYKPVATVVDRIGKRGSYVEKLGVTRSQVLSIDA
ncbi:UNVERIFIED_CONTAM: hypothetical protein Sindi_1308100 [Sesamum indicum]